MRLFHEVMGVGQALVQKIVGTVKEAYLADIRNRTTNYINVTVVVVLTHLQNKYGQLMPHELLERLGIISKTIYNPRDPIVTVLSTVEELLKFAEIMGSSYTQLQAVNIAYMIIHRTGKFGIAIRNCNQMTAIQKTWMQFKQFPYISPNPKRDI